MQYMLLIYEVEANFAAMDQERMQAMMGEYMAFTRKVTEAGAFVAGDALEPVATATTVRVKSGERMMTDGPFAETKEQLGGYYLLECANLDEALDWAAQIPAARTGSIEVRPVSVY